MKIIEMSGGRCICRICAMLTKIAFWLLRCVFEPPGGGQSFRKIRAQNGRRIASIFAVRASSWSSMR